MIKFYQKRNILRLFQITWISKKCPQVKCKCGKKTNSVNDKQSLVLDDREDYKKHNKIVC